MKLSIIGLLGLFSFNALATITLLERSERESKYSLVKYFKVTEENRRKIPLDTFCEGLAGDQDRIIKPMKEQCQREKLVYKSAVYSKCDWDADEDLEMRFEFSCVAKPEGTEDLDCSSARDCWEKKQNQTLFRNMRAVQAWSDEIRKQMPPTGTREASEFYSKQVTSQNIIDCEMSLSLGFSIGQMARADFKTPTETPRACQKIIEKWKAREKEKSFFEGLFN